MANTLTCIVCLVIGTWFGMTIMALMAQSKDAELIRLLEETKKRLQLIVDTLDEDGEPVMLRKKGGQNG